MLRPLFFNSSLIEEFFPHERNLISTNIKELVEGYIIELGIPGFTKEDIDINVNGDYLTVNASKSVNKKSEENDKYILKEISSSDLKRRFYIGKLDKESIEANYVDGLLTISIKKNKNDIYSKKIELK